MGLWKAWYPVHRCAYRDIVLKQFTARSNIVSNLVEKIAFKDPVLPMIWYPLSVWGNVVRKQLTAPEIVSNNSVLPRIVYPLRIGGDATKFDPIMCRKSQHFQPRRYSRRQLTTAR
jgi:hypothetical protein